MKRQDNQILAFTHLSQLLNFVTGYLGFIVSLIIWITQKDRVFEMDSHGKAALNFQISYFLYFIACIPLILLFGLGLLGMLVLGLLSVIYPIVNAVNASNNREPEYPFVIPFIK